MYLTRILTKISILIKTLNTIACIAGVANAFMNSKICECFRKFAGCVGITGVGNVSTISYYSITVFLVPTLKNISIKDYNDRFTTVPLEALSDQLSS